MSMFVNSLTLIVTNRCNLACGYCFEGEKAYRDMDVETGTATIDWLFRDDVSGPSTDLDITLFGGEPLLNLRVIRAVVARGKALAARDGRRIRFNATTNGTLFCGRVSDYWRAEGLSVLLSCDGVREAHDMHRRFRSGRGSFAALEPNIDRIVAASDGKEVRMTITPETAPYVAEGVRFLKRQGFRNVAVYYVEEEHWDEASLLALEEQFYEAGEIFADAIEQGEGFSLNPLDRAIQTVCGEKKLAHAQLCGAGRSFLAVGTQGTLYPCHRFATISDATVRARYAIGDIRRGIDEMQRLPYLRIGRDSVLGCDIACRDCSLQGLCLGGCMAANVTMTGQLTMRPPAARLHELMILEVARSIVAYFDEHPSEHFEHRFRNHTRDAYVA